MRFTFGDYVLPKDREGYAVSGMHFIKGSYMAKTPISTKEKFLLELTDSHLTIYTNSFGKFKEFVKMSRKFPNENVCVGFKNMTFNITEEPSVITSKEVLAPAALLD